MPITAWLLRANASGAPISRDSASATSPSRFLYSRSMARSSSIRSCLVVSENVANALRAAFTARSTSAALPTAIWVNVSSVEGSATSRRAGVIGSTHLPSM